MHFAGPLNFDVMQLENDPLRALGRPYVDVQVEFGGKPTLSLFQERDEGEPDERYAEAEDGRWQCLLDQDGKVKTVFLFGDKDCSFPYSLAPGMSQEQVLAAMREPASCSKTERDIPGMGRVGAFVRWNRPTHSVHAEFAVGNGLRQLTFMLPQYVPGAA